MILNLSLDLPEDGAYVRIARRIARTLLEELKVVDADTSDLELVIGELCTNVIRHADTESGRFRIVLLFYADRVELTVEDTGKGFSFKDVPEAGTERPDTVMGGERIGGFGMGLVQALADYLEFHRTDPRGTTVRACIDLHYQTPEDAQKAEELDADSGGGCVSASP